MGTPNNEPKTEKMTEEKDTIGEGNYDASRRYREGLESSLKKGDTEELAKKAKEALDGPAGDELRRADEAGKRAEIPKK